MIHAAFQLAEIRTNSIVLLVLLASCRPQVNEPENITKIAFGSCGHETEELPIFNLVVDHQPDVFVFLGDNIYGDTKDMEELKAKYQQLADKASFRNLKSNVPIIATWDDHDYGWNDTGRHFPFKKETKEIFLDFFDEPDSSQRRSREGIFTSYLYPYGDNILQIILLDNRTFRDDLKPYAGEVEDDKRYFYDLDYSPHTNSDSTLLGEQQWRWLEQELQIPADIRIIGSGSQFSIEYNGYEAWANFPHEQKRMIDLIKKVKADGVFFITGDVHYSEISKLKEENIYPIYDFTSSGLSSTWHFATPNKHRIEGPVMDNHFGLITINWSKKPIQISMETWDVYGNQRFEYSFGLDEISF